ncbi:MAG TPA: cytochrome c oxidase subunit 3 [Pirellulales bacterium]|nr:cytochrome c oxidase subunit 3 [Pirellulales bacterium]
MSELAANTSGFADHGGTTGLPFPPAIAPEKALNTAQWGMLAFLLSEASFFSTLITSYLAYLGQDTAGPTPREVLSLPLVFATTICLVASSGTIHLAEKRLHENRAREFLLAWAATTGLGIVFLLGTAYEWRQLIVEHQLTISRNLFGTTFYTLVGFHALHVTIGIAMMLGLAGLMLGRRLSIKEAQPVQLVSWYWHFVDGVWLAVFTIVYLVGR